MARDIIPLGAICVFCVIACLHLCLVPSLAMPRANHYGSVAPGVAEPWGAPPTLEASAPRYQTVFRKSPSLVTAVGLSVLSSAANSAASRSIAAS